MSVDETGNPEAEYQASAIRGPKANEPYVLALDGNVQQVDLDTVFKALGARSRYLSFRSDVSNFNYAYSDVAIADGGTISPTATAQTGGTCVLALAQEKQQEYATGRYLLVKGVSGDKLRVWISSF